MNDAGPDAPTRLEGRSTLTDWRVLVPWLLIAAGVALRLAHIAPQRLWSDEAYSAATAQGSLLDVIVSGIRYDIHPPLYYMQLAIWRRLGGSDVWLILNSLVYAFATLVSLYYSVGRLFGRAAGRWATAIYAIMPVQIVFAETLRMYTLEALIVVWLIYHVEQLARSVDRQGFHLWSATALAVLINATHGFGPVVSFFVLLYALVRLWQAGYLPRRWASLILPLIVIGLSGVYAVAIGYVRDTVGLAQFSIRDVLVAFNVSLLGFNDFYPPLFGLIAVLLVIGIASAAGWNRALLVLIGFFAPIALMIAMSVILKPVFTFRAASLFTPLLAIGLASAVEGVPSGVSDRRREVARLLLLVLTGLMLVLAIVESGSYRKQDYRKLALAWQAQARPGEPLYDAGMVSDFQAFTRYLPDMGPLDSLAVQPPFKDRWKARMARIPAATRQRLRLDGQADHVAYGGRPIYIWFDPDKARAAPVFWVLQNTGTVDCGVPHASGRIVSSDSDIFLVRCQAKAH